ncbi:hypothetical protein L6164_036163 [Bauhinia variegata]|uniref:Uncharacterized protein n=1 Tax=Bauhinia variegata TaxID=167791 RepID=A0ACB9KG34_BAUVA|nr:hypothetical protein L6164_036163 [Bauhinia variegata]
MSVRQRPTTTKKPSISDGDTRAATPDPDTARILPQQPPAAAPSLPRSTLWQTLTGTANLANLLPTGTLLAFQILTPVFTKNGACDSVTRCLTLFLLLLLALSCFLASFTDTLKCSNGRVYYGLATFKGLWLFDYPDPSGSGSLPDLSKYRLRFIDWLHAVLSVLVFGAVALRDKNLVNCFYPTPGHETQEVLDIVPVGIGLICSLLFVVFPTRRHGIGYPVTQDK